MSKINTYYKRELDILIDNIKKDNDECIVENFIPEILSLCEKFRNSGQSGGSAPYVADTLCFIIKNLLLQKPISPIYNTSDEWMEVDGNGMYQNNRCYALFKDGKNGRPYYLDAIVWSGEEEYDTFTGKVEGYYSRQYVKEFPFVPKTFYIDVYEDDLKNGYKINNISDLKKVFEYYDNFNEK